MARRIILLFIFLSLLITVGYPVLAVGEGDFWDAWQQENYAKAAALAKELGTALPEYYSLAAICYQNILKYDESLIYKNRFQQLGSPDTLRELLINQQNISQNNPQVLYCEGMIATLFPETKLGDPITYLEKAVLKLNNNPYIYNYLAQSEMDAHNYSDTVQKYLQKAITLKKDYPESYVNLAVFLTNNNQEDKAITELLDCFNNCPQVPSKAYETMINLTSTTIKTTIKPFGQPMSVSIPNIKEQYLRPIKVGLNKSPRHLLGLAEYLINEGNTISARDLLENVTDKSSSLYLYLQLKMAHLDGNSDQVITLADNLLTSNDLNYQRLFEVGNIFFYTKDFNKAIAFYEASLKQLNPDDHEFLLKIYTNLGTSFYFNQNYLKAVDSLGKALVEDPQDPSALIYLGLTYRDMGDKDKAVELLKKSLEYIPDPQWRQEITGIINELNPPETKATENP